MPLSGLVVSGEGRAVLESWARSQAIRASYVERARIVLAVADGNGTAGTARLVGVSRPTVNKWRDRFVAHGLAGLDDEPRPGRPETVDDAGIIAATLEPPPEALAVTHWSSREGAPVEVAGRDPDGIGDRDDRGLDLGR
jgi:transposase-like protein